MSRLIEKHGKKLLIFLIVVPVILVSFIIFDSIRSNNKEHALVMLEELEEIIENFSQDETSVSHDEIEGIVKEIHGETNNRYVIHKSNFLFAMWNSLHMRWSQAEEIFYRMYEQKGRSHLREISIYNAAIAAEEQGNYEQAITYLEMYVADYSTVGSPLISRALFTLGRLHERIDDTDNAIRLYQQVIDQHSGSGWVDLSKNRLVILNIK